MSQRTPRRDFERPLATVDVAIFAVRDGRLHVLLVRRSDDADAYPGRWALPGGFIDVQKDADLEACALRKLREKTAVAAPYLEQLGSWGDAKRDPRGWSVTQAYFALVPADEVSAPQGGANAADAAWHEVVGDGVGNALAFDHARILAVALDRLRGKVEYTSLPAFLLPKEFTLGELQKVYETVLGRRLDKSAFRTRILATDLLAEIAKVRGGPNRPARLYRLKSRKAPVFFQRTFKPAG